MTLQAPFIATPLRSHIAEGLDLLTEQSRKKLTESDKKLGAQLLADAYCDMLDNCLFDLLREVHRNHPSSELKEALDSADGVKEKIHSCLSWVVGFFSSERLAPVIAHFNELARELDLHEQRQFFIAFNLKSEIASDASRVLDSLSDSTARNAVEGVELLLQVIEDALEPLVHKPKQLMKFNFVVNKTLDGVISLVMTLIRRTLRKLAPQLPRQAFPLVALHLGRFLILSNSGDFSLKSA